KVTNAQKQTLTNCWLWIANYSKEPRATAPWSYWALWQYCGDGKCRLPRAAYPIRTANIAKAELNVFRGSQSELQDFWPRRAWYGSVPDRPDYRDKLYTAIAAPPKKLPKKVDLRHNCSRVEDQGQLGSCTANALVGNLEFLERKAGHTVTNLSRLFVYYNER